MSDIRPHREVGQSSGAPVESANVRPACGTVGETVTPDPGAGLTRVDDEMPPPPRPLPDAVAQVAAGLLLAPERAGPTGLPTFAGYETLGPLGRGGTGLVYEARQLRHNRVVALKMIRGGAHAQPGDLARFRSEAEAVARLRHPDIVPIYEVGETDGWAYCALEFMAGGSLARRLAGRPQPAGTAAQLVETLASAMDYAHAQGIIHRDLKPANVLLALDGTPKISDFGLAKRLGSEIEPGIPGDRTPSGEVLGTPAYMAPEQTWGRPGAVGRAADIYALGAILYECLTGRPPFQAAAPLDTLLQVRTEEPVPPRRLVPSVPRDLETICLKCLQKEPRRRYPSAGALAEDLHLFLVGQPVLARPIGAWERAVRWARRRKAVTALAGVSGAAVLSLASLGVWHYAQLQAYNAELLAERNTANGLRELAEGKEAEARRQQEEAERQGKRAEANSHKALDAVVQMLARVSEDDDRLAHEPRMQRVRQNLLQDALRFCKDLLRQKDTDPPARQETAAIYLHMGDMQRRLGQAAAAEEAYSAAIQLYRALAAEFPQRPAYRFELAGCYTNLGNLLADTPRRGESDGAYRRALEIQQALVEEFPGSPDYRSDLAGNLHNLGTSLSEDGQLKEAENLLRSALDHRLRLAEEFPENAAYQQDVARSYNTLGHVLEFTDRLHQAEQTCRRALDLQQRLVEKFPRVPAYREELAGSHNSLANMLSHASRLPEAEAEYGHALALQQRLVEDFPRVPAHRFQLASSHYNLALLLEQTKRLPEAEQAGRRALAFFRGLVDEFPKVPAYQSALGDNRAHLARVLRDQGRLVDARREAEEALRDQLSALKLIPEHPRFMHALAGNYEILAETLLQMKDHDAAGKVAAELPGYFPTQGRAYLHAAGIAARCVPLAQQDQALLPQRRVALATAYGDQAMALLQEGLGNKLDPEQLKADLHLASLRPRADFQKLLRALEGAGRSPAVQRPGQASGAGKADGR
jgi:tetratricopeptide (TPR) repeat protein